MEMFNNVNKVEDWSQFIKDGNLDALSRVYFKYYDQLLTYGLKHSLDKQAVEDSIQNVFLNLIKFRKNISEIKNLTGYLLSSFRRQLFADVGKQKLAVLSDQFPEEKFDYFKSQDQGIEEKENFETVLDIIYNCIDKLSSRQREILYLKFQTGISYVEIAEMLDISVDSCYKSIHRSVKFLRAELEKTTGKGDILILMLLLSAEMFGGRRLNLGVL